MESSNDLQEFKLGKYKFLFPKDVKHETTECDCYSVVSFFIKNESDKYEVIDNQYMGYRLFISNRSGWQDVPFKRETFWLLPPEIKVIEEEE